MSVALEDSAHPTRAGSFAGRVLEVLNGGALALMTSLGHRSGLFDVMAGLPPSTSDAIARAAGLDERYVREWLAALVTGGFVVHDPAAGTYFLPPEHAACLTRAAGARNLAQQACYIPLLASVEDAVLESFRHGGGVPYSAYARFQDLMAEESAAVFDASLLEATLPRSPGLVGRLESGIDVLDVGCGRGHAIHLMAAAFPRSRFTGLDFSSDAITAARSEAARRGLSNARFEVEDASQLCGVARYDLITAFDAIHDQAAPAVVLRCIASALRPAGTFLMVETASSSHVHENLNHPLGPFLYAVSCMHCMTVSLAQDGAGLGTMWGEQKAMEMLHEAAFTKIDRFRIGPDLLSHGYVATRA